MNTSIVVLALALLQACAAQQFYQKWASEIVTDYPRNFGLPAVVNGTAYFQGTYNCGYKLNVVAVEYKTGKQKFNVEYDRPNDCNFHSAPVIEGGKIFFNNDGAGITAIDAETGGKVWRTRLPVNSTLENSNLVAGKADGSLAVVVTAYKSTLYAVNAATGDHLWTAPAHGNAFSLAFATLTSGRGAIIVGSDPLTLHDAATGKVLWKTPVPGNPTGAELGRAHVHAGGIFLQYSRPYGTGKVHKFRLADGGHEWTYQMPHRHNGLDWNNLAFASSTYTNKAVVVSVRNNPDKTSYVLGIDTVTGKKQGTSSAPVGSDFGSVTAESDIIVVNSPNQNTIFVISNYVEMAAVTSDFCTRHNHTGVYCATTMPLITPMGDLLFTAGGSTDHAKFYAYYWQ